MIAAGDDRRRRSVTRESESVSEQAGGGRPVLVLFFMAPFTGEFLLGNLTLTELPLGVLLAPLYGFGAIVVREVGRRSGGWASIAVLAVAYALIEEGPVDQLLWNSDYAGVDYVNGPGHIEAFGLNVMTVQVVIAIHAVWSICVPIALTESLHPRRAREPWLTRRGLVLIGLLYVVAAALVCWGNWIEEQFWASPAQIGSMAVLIAALIVVGIRLQPASVAVPAAAPPPPVAVAAVILAFTSIYWGPLNLTSSTVVAWLGFALWWLVAAAGIGLLLRWSGSRSWSATHRYSAAAGATLTYVWVAFPLQPEGGSRAVDIGSNVVFGLLALVILAAAGRRAIRSDQAIESEDRQAESTT